jgi:spermidine/putrescine transport system permease protein
MLTVAYSFWTQDYLTLDKTASLTNYREVVDDPLYQLLILRSLIISVLVTVVTVVLSYPIAYFIAFRTERKALWLILVTLPFWISYLLRVFSWKIILGYNGVLNTGLMATGVIDQPLEFTLYSAEAVVIVLAHAWAPFAILPIYVALQKVDRSMLEAARDLGDSDFMRFIRVTLPISMSGVISASMIIMIPTVGDYVTPAMVGGSDGLMIANMIQVQFGKANNWPLGAALALSAMFCIAVVAIGYAALLRFTGKSIR